MKKKWLILLTCLLSACLLGIFTACDTPNTSESESGSESGSESASSPQQPNTYTITFVDYDDEVISTATYEEGETVTVPTDPTRDADLTYTYEFAGWDSEVSETATQNATYKATYTSNYIDYTVTFLAEDGEEVLQTGTFHYGDTVTAPNLPANTEDETFTYVYSWDAEVVAVAGNATYTVVCTKDYVNYVVKFLNADGSDFEVQNYHYGEAIVAPTTNPSKDADNTYTYTFAGWGEVAQTVTAPGLTYTATFTPEYINYSVAFVDDDGTELLRKDDYHYGDSVVEPSEDPSKAPNVLYSYTFDGWDEDVEDVTGNKTYTAVYSEIANDGYNPYKATANGETIVLGQSGIGGGANYTKGQQNDDGDETPSFVDQSYLALVGEYGLNSYVAFDFTGKNMPEVAFFANNYNNSMYAEGTDKTGIVVYTGITTWNGENAPINQDKANGTYINYGFPYMIQDAANGGFTRGAFANSALGRANLVDGTHYRVVMGFTNYVENGGLQLNWFLYNLDTKTVVENSSMATWNFFTGSNGDVGNMTLDDLVGSIVLYGKFGTTCTIDKLHGVYANKTLNEVLTSLVYEGKANNVKLAAGGISNGADYTKGQQAAEGAIVNQNYYAIKGNYGVDNYLVMDFTGRNMPEVAFFAKNYNNTMYAEGTTKQGIVVVTGITKWDGSLESGVNDNGTQIKYGFPYMIQDAADGGFVRQSEKASKLARANLVEGTHYRVIIGFTAYENGGIQLKWCLYNLDTKTVVEEESLASWNFFTGNNERVGNMTVADLVGDIVLYGKFGVDCDIDLIHGVENGAFADIVAKYTTQA